jgi:hypothetical protein
VVNNSLRQEGRTPTARVHEEDEDEAQVETSTPAEHVIDSEERAILLPQLQELPPLYREPMVLFYRQNESVAEVAEVLGISEDAVKQRLSRGRVMLAERVERSLGSVLRTTVPTTAFTLAVMGVLAASTPPASAAAATGAGAKLAKGSALGGAAVVPLITGAAGMWGLFRFTTQSARTPRERRFAAWALAGAPLFGFAISWAFGMRGIHLMAGSSWLVVGSLLFGVLVQSSAFAFGFWHCRRRQRIRMEDGLSPEVARSVWRVEPGDKGFWPGVIGSAVVLGSACNLPHVLLVLGWIRTLVIALPLGLAALAVAALLRWPWESRRVLMALTGALFVQHAGLTAYMWQISSQPKEAWRHSIGIIAFQSFYLGIWLVMAIGFYLYWRWEKKGGGGRRGPRHSPSEKSSLRHEKFRSSHSRHVRQNVLLPRLLFVHLVHPSSEGAGGFDADSKGRSCVRHRTQSRGSQSGLHDGCRGCGCSCVCHRARGPAGALECPRWQTSADRATRRPGEHAADRGVAWACVHHLA